ncbi:DUF2520 domain-containing protein [Elizabethkingia anophelis]|uniref:Rossmann-like and DUF2520 domain-containing protein n=1 Tax=Elizabethkingia anophelis TaxID=1117645 RepID=UPI000999EFEF|nr:Rossmann-like and DUF2520 domain-containing protein [Elizabethkingia anophelis]ELB0068393.1 DUF2520 domain-containing protein [Elizabethkingia anophelis]ELB1893088.1 DUF2520 domain-containing protein [Elizabethkingia anophelis]ELB1895186.1 DUF2520 domain-containing protein [Elizabethkingia anophelis]MDV2443615.1 DUF2520 domain-containing protein [Elizabethkingia anophelis]MDV3895742.1 DUF2520 domain-containing protein [Elizabethkingia anophelis]
MTTVIIGSGNVAWHMAKAFKEAGIDLIQLYGRNEQELKKLSLEINVEYSTNQLKQADFYLICTSDKAIAEVSKQIPYEQALVAHTSGSLSRDVLEGSYRKASFYPLQTFSKSRKLDYSKIPLFVDAGWESDNILLTDLAKKISTNVMRINHEQRKQMHLSAVFACNFVNHLYAHAEIICKQNDISFNYLLPLIEETADKIKTISPKDAQTGPAVRNDQNIIKFQENLIVNPNQLNIYKILTESITKMYEL